jgi:hypothetical protein
VHLFAFLLSALSLSLAFSTLLLSFSAVLASCAISAFLESPSASATFVDKLKLASVGLASISLATFLQQVKLQFEVLALLLALLGVAYLMKGLMRELMVRLAVAL